MMMAITIATIGRRMKKFDMACYFVVSGVSEAAGAESGFESDGD
jgi:hypothetical protein